MILRLLYRHILSHTIQTFKQNSNTLVMALPAIPLNFAFPPAAFSPATLPCLLAEAPKGRYMSLFRNAEPPRER